MIRHSAVGREIQLIGRSLSSIAGALARLSPLIAAASASTNRSPTGRVRKLSLSPKRRAALRLQGQYMGYLRNLKPGQKTRVKAARTSKGIRAAIALGKQLSNGAKR
jgi:hypothetical protein